MAPTYEYTERFGPQLCQKGVKFKPTPHGPFGSKRDMIYTKTFYYCLWWPLSRPYYVPVGIKDWWKKEHSEPRLSEKAFHKQRTTDKPRKLPTKRKRELSLPRKASRLPWKNVPKTTDFLTKLPYDIRYMIWELVIPQREVSIFHGKRRLVHLLHRGKRMKINARKQTNNLLAVMKTCRLIYAETIPLLYLRTHFNIHQNDTLAAFQSTIIPARFSAIRSLTLHWQFNSYVTFERNAVGKSTSKIPAPWDAGTWANACKILASMSALRKLVIDVRGGFMYERHIADMLEYLRDVNVQDEGEFRVIVPGVRFRVKMGSQGWGTEIDDRGFGFEVVRQGQDPYVFDKKSFNVCF